MYSFKNGVPHLIFSWYNKMHTPECGDNTLQMFAFEIRSPSAFVFCHAIGAFPVFWETCASEIASQHSLCRSKFSCSHISVGTDNHLLHGAERLWANRDVFVGVHHQVACLNGLSSCINLWRACRICIYSRYHLLKRISQVIDAIHPRKFTNFTKGVLGLNAKSSLRVKAK